MVLVVARCWYCAAFAVVAVGITGARSYSAGSESVDGAGVYIAVVLFDVIFCLSIVLKSVLNCQIFCSL